MPWKRPLHSCIYVYTKKSTLKFKFTCCINREAHLHGNDHCTLVHLYRETYMLFVPTISIHSAIYYHSLNQNILTQYATTTQQLSGHMVSNRAYLVRLFISHELMGRRFVNLTGISSCIVTTSSLLTIP